MVIKTQDENLKKENYVETIINLLTVPFKLKFSHFGRN